MIIMFLCLVIITLSLILLIIQFNMIEQNILELIHFVKKKINDRIICISFVNSENQLAGIFTKDLSSISIKDIYAIS